MMRPVDRLLSRLAEGRISRREFVRRALALGISGPAAISLLSRRSEAQTGGAVHLNFMVWSYGIETIQDNIKSFQQGNPNITVTLQDTSWFNYHDAMATKFTTGDAPDVAYCSDHWLREWVAADWIMPLDQSAPELTGSQGEWAPYAREGMTLNGHLYGLPYYADLIIFMYNAKMLKQAGFDHPPATWEELASQAKTIKDKGISQYPIDIPLKKDDPWTIEIFYSMVYSRGGHMFDKNDTPVFNVPGSKAEQALQWLRDALQSKIMDPAVLESAEPDVVKTMGAGQHVYTVLAKYNLAELNEGQHEQKGNFKMVLMPGATHSTVGFVRFYALTKATAGRHHVEAASKFLQYFGGKTNGKYVVAQRWALEKGLGFAQLPLYDDPQIKAAINAWGNVSLEQQQAKLATVKEGLTPSWGTWDVFARQQIGSAVVGSIPPRQALQSMADKWSELK
jgi:multiple sugar transport system substrate-binding protein